MSMHPHAAHRKVFGPRRHRSEPVKALHVAESILDRESRGDAWDWQRSYGIDPTSPYGQLVQRILAARRAQEGATA